MKRSMNDVWDEFSAWVENHPATPYLCLTGSVAFAAIAFWCVRAMLAGDFVQLPILIGSTCGAASLLLLSYRLLE